MKLKWTSKLFRVDLDSYLEKKSELKVQAEFLAPENSAIEDIFIGEPDLSNLAKLEHETTYELYSGLRAKIRGVDLRGARYGSVVSVSDKTSWTLSLISRHARFFRNTRTSISDIIDVLLNNATAENYTAPPAGRLNYIHLGLKPKRSNQDEKGYVANDIRGLNKVFISNTTTEWTESDEKNQDVIEIFIPELTYHPIELFRILYLSLFMPELINKNELSLLSIFFSKIGNPENSSEIEKKIYERTFDLEVDDFYQSHIECKKYVKDYKHEAIERNKLRKQKNLKNKNSEIKEEKSKKFKEIYSRARVGFSSPSHRAQEIALHRNKLMIGSISKAHLNKTFQRFELLKDFSSKSGKLIFD